MTFGRTGKMRTAFPDDGFGNNERGLVHARFSLGKRLIDGLDIVSVNRSDDVPPVGFEALTVIVGKPVFHIAVNRNSVIVVDGNELIEFPDTGKRASLVADAFHHAPVA